MNRHPLHLICRVTSVAREKGMSLVELMVGLSIGMVLTLGLFTMIANTSQTFKVQDDFARMQENATAALRFIGEAVRSAGFFGYARQVGTITNPTSAPVNTAGDCGSTGGPIANPPVLNWALDFTTPLAVYTGLNSTIVNAVFPCIRQTNFKDGVYSAAQLPNANPILVTRAAFGYRIPDIAPLGNLILDLAAQTDYKTTVYLQSDPNAGLIFLGADFANLKAAAVTRTNNLLQDIDIFEYRVGVYYIRPCSRPGLAPPNCQRDDDGGQPIPTLVRQELSAGTMVEVPLVEGIELISYTFGIDDAPAAPNGFASGTGDGIPDRYMVNPLSTDWANVVSVRVAVLVRATTADATYDDRNKTYDLNGDGIPDFRCIDYLGQLPGQSPLACNYKRKVFTQQFQLRNVAQRRGG